MDALALLCTLHADGPATLKELRANGCGDLVRLISSSPDDLAQWLNAEPAFARRMIREAKILRGRVGGESLDREEAPPVPAAPETVLPEAPPTISDQVDLGEGRVELDANDRELVSLIRSMDRAPEQAPLETHVQAAPQPNAPTAAPLVAHAEPAPERETEALPQAEPTPIEMPEAIEADVVPEAATEPHSSTDLLPNAISGLDAEMVEDLTDLGIRSLAELAAADSLGLTRSLGITFAQARRLRFLARRAASSTPAPAPTTTPGPAAPSPVTEPEPIQAVAAVEAAPLPVQQEVPSTPEPQAAPIAAPAPEAVPVSEPAATLEPVVDSEPSEPPARAAFWEPRAFLRAEEHIEEQGVKIDPSEIEARPRFGDRFREQQAPAPAPAPASARSVEEPTPQTSVDAAPRDPAPTGTVLGWNFEIPRPESEMLPGLSASIVPLDPPSTNGAARATKPAGPDADTAGPFA